MQRSVGRAHSGARVIQGTATHDQEALQDELIHAQRFADLKQLDAGDEIQRAIRFLYLTRYSFGAAGKNFSDLKATSTFAALRELIRKTSERLDGVAIVNRHFEYVLRRYDSADTFFFCDPPYFQFGNCGQYQKMDPGEHERLTRLLLAIKGKFILSYDDRPEVRALYKTARIRGVRGLYSFNAKRNDMQSRELLISNF